MNKGRIVNWRRTEQDGGAALDRGTRPENVTDFETARTILNLESPFLPNAGVGSKVDPEQETAPKAAPISANSRMLAQAAMALINSGRGYIDEPDERSKPGKRFVESEQGFYNVDPSKERLKEFDDDPDWRLFQSKVKTPEQALQYDEELRIQDYLNQLALQEDVRVKRKLDHEEIAGRGSRLARIGKSIRAAVKSVATAVPRLIDAVLPASMQIVPKMEMIAGQRTARSRELAEAERAYREDVLKIQGAYDSIGEYVYQAYDSQNIPRFDTDNQSAINDFIVECKFEETSPHYAAIKSKVDRKLAERKAKYDHQVAAISNDNSAFETAEQMESELKQTSWRYRLLEKARNIFSTNKRQIVTPTVETVQPIAVTNTPEVLTQNEPAVNSPSRISRWKWALAAVAGLTASSFAGNLKNPSVDQPQAVQIASDNTPELQPSTQPPAAASSRKEAINLQLENVGNKQAQKQNLASQQKAETVPHQRNAKGVSLNGIKTYPRSTDLNPRTISPNPEAGSQTAPPENIDPAQKPVTEAERIAQLQLVEGKIAAYGRKLAEINRDKTLIDRYSNGSTVSMQNGRIPQLLDSITGKMANLRIASDLNRVNATLAEIDRVIAADEATVKTLNEAVTLIPLGQALDQLAAAQRLAGSVNASFTIQHLGQDGQILPYNVSLREIQTRLAGIQGRIQNYKNTSLEQARADKANSEYYVSALKFYNWNLQYNRNHVVLH